MQHETKASRANLVQLVLSRPFVCLRKKRKTHKTFSYSISDLEMQNYKQFLHFQQNDGLIFFWDRIS